MDHAEGFDDIVSAISTTSTLHGATQEARARLHREHPGGFDIARIAHEVWPQLTDVQKVRALEELFTAYVIRLHDEERAARLDRDATSGVTHLEEFDVDVLHDAVAGAAPIGGDTEIDGVCASALHNVLAELELLQHRGSA
ncbi:hypothetical protein [Streptomyces sp. 4N124]|uniref:hypothetical protein n=1 Tax=Streptomyces sp. 4N124 TaxID=3457420 RepID=UPI003FD4CCF0